MPQVSDVVRAAGWRQGSIARPADNETLLAASDPRRPSAIQAARQGLPQPPGTGRDVAARRRRRRAVARWEEGPLPPVWSTCGAVDNPQGPRAEAIGPDTTREDAMPNGGSDCCGTCWFNRSLEGQRGSANFNHDIPSHCEIRDLDIPDPFHTYCANPPYHRPGRDAIPIGPVYVHRAGDPSG